MRKRSLIILSLYLSIFTTGCGKVVKSLENGSTFALKGGEISVARALEVNCQSQSTKSALCDCWTQNIGKTQGRLTSTHLGGLMTVEWPETHFKDLRLWVQSKADLYCRSGE